MVWLHSGQRGMGSGQPSMWPVVNGFGERGSNSLGCSGLTLRAFNKVSEAQVRRWAVRDMVSLGFLLPLHSPWLWPSLVDLNTWAVILDLLPFPVCHYWSLLTSQALLQVFAHSFTSTWNVLHCSTLPTESLMLGLDTTYSGKPLMIMLGHSALIHYTPKFPPASLLTSHSSVLTLLTYLNVGMLGTSSWASFLL